MGLFVGCSDGGRIAGVTGRFVGHLVGHLVGGGVTGTAIAIGTGCELLSTHSLTALLPPPLPPPPPPPPGKTLLAGLGRLGNAAALSSGQPRMLAKQLWVGLEHSRRDPPGQAWQTRLALEADTPHCRYLVAIVYWVFVERLVRAWWHIIGYIDWGERECGIVRTSFRARRK